MSPRPAGGYKLASGERVPGVTSILEQWGDNKRGLCYWNWQQGKAGKEFKETLEKEATLGTLIHAAIEAELAGKTYAPFPAEHKDRAENAMLAFYEWQSAFQLEVTGSEIALVSETYQYGGTIDHAVKLRGRRAICDLKTAKDLYKDHRVQLAAYGQLWRECYPDDPPQGYHLLRVGKEDGSFSHHYWPSLQTEMEIFLHLRELYDLAKALK